MDSVHGSSFVQSSFHWQRPPAQLWTDEQALVQLPQCSGSLPRSTQLPVQFVSPDGQAQAPPWQTRFPPQT
jgi:hypothetical protein